MGNVNPFQADLLAARAQLQLAHERLDKLNTLWSRITVPHFSAQDDDILAYGNTLMNATWNSYTMMVAAVPGHIDEMPAIITALDRKVADLQAKHDAWEAKIDQLVAGGATEDEAYDSLHTQEMIKSNVKTIALAILGIAAVGLLIWGLVKLYKRMKK